MIKPAYTGSILFDIPLYARVQKQVSSYLYLKK